MARSNDFSARGVIVEVRDDTVVFNPQGTNYQLYLQLADGQTLPEEGGDRVVDGLIHLAARKVWTVPSGGNFVEPIMGRPRIIQGRVRWLDKQTLVVQAGTLFVVQMPKAESAVDIPAGPIEVGALVNVTVLPGATLELATTG